jgi:mRNA interferase MazF
VPIIQVVPITEWSEKKAKIITNVVLEPTEDNGLSKKSVADCLQTRPIDHAERLVSVLGMLSQEDMAQIDTALKIVFQLE